MKKKYFITCFIFLLFFYHLWSATIYVNSTAAGDNDGSDWTNAYTSFQSALEAASSGDEIWVAKGTYYPSSDYSIGGGSRFYHFRMINGVAIYGGFAGTESAVSERTDYLFGEINETILSADIGIIDNKNDNCYHVFYHPSGINNTAILDGFRIKRGNANGSNPHNKGGGMYNNASSPTINNCTFISNWASYGAGMYNDSYSSPIIKNGYFRSNPASIDGGGMYNYEHSSPTLTNCCFASNSASNSVSEGGGIENDNWSSPSLTNCTITSNSAVYGGGVYNYWYSSPTLTNCIIWGNEASLQGNDFYVYNGTTTVSYCCYIKNAANVHDIGTFSQAGGNIAADPQFVGSENNTLHPYSIGGISPCCDVGSNSANSETYDLRGSGFPRKLNKTSGEAGTIDIGAYEYKAGVDPSLPVTLSKFTAQFIENMPTLYWVTHSEIDNMGWFVYRNAENDFSSSELISEMIEGHGTTTQQQSYVYEDSIDNSDTGAMYYYWLESIDYSGTINHYDQVAVLTIPDPSANPPQITPPVVYDLKNVPNPVHSNTEFKFILDSASIVSVDIYNILGQRVYTSSSIFTQPDQTYAIYWNGKDEQGQVLENGIYFYNLIINSKIKTTKKLIMMK